jgi:unsaturated rhamnogalacturonyl hydrolase
MKLLLTIFLLLFCAARGFAQSENIGKGRTVLLDSFFNNEFKKDESGKLVSWHYKWDETTNGGFSSWAGVFRSFGVKTETLTAAPTAENLKSADIYIIVDADTPQETEHPNFIEAPHIKAITGWVRNGGVLVLMGNDLGNAEFDHVNQLAAQFGVQFNKDSKNKVVGNEFQMGKIVTPESNPIFKTPRTLFLKELSTLALTSPAKPLLEHNGDVIMAVSKLGKGTVFVIGDPWLYNEYVDGKKLPPEYENLKAAGDLTLWLIGHSRKKSS